MIRVKKKINPKLVISLVLLCSFVLLLTASILLNVLSGDDSTGADYGDPPHEILEGEGAYGHFNLAYPMIADADIQYISVSDKANSFKVARPDEKGNLILYYTDANGNLDVYYPNILGTDENIDYSKLYAIATGDGLGMIPEMSYLCSAVGLTSFQERIALSDDPLERAAQLASFGLTAAEQVSITVSFTVEGEEEEQTHNLKVGKRSNSGAGRYYTVDDRDYVYCAATDYMEYALRGFVSFVKPYIVTEGMAGDESVLAAYLTQDFKEWKNTVHDKKGEKVTAGSTLVGYAQTVVPYDYPIGYIPNPGEKMDGYKYSAYEKTTFDFELNAGKNNYVRMINALVGKGVGVYYDRFSADADESDSIIFTLSSQSRVIDFGEKDALTYAYKIYAIESIITDEVEIIDEGTPVGDNNLLKITYSYTVDGQAVSEGYSHALIDLNDERLPAETRAALKAAKIGCFDTTVDFELEYTVDTAVKYNIEYVICDILEIYDKNGSPTTTITDTSSVVYRYYLVVDGVKDVDVHVGTVVFSESENDTESEDEKMLREALYKALAGKSIAADIELSVIEFYDYSEILYDFITYRVAEISYFITKELITSFGFKNASYRDPFYGESIYENTMEGKYSLYGINADACIEIVKFLTGIATDSSTSSTAAGLVADKTIALGLTPEVMEKYGLYAYTVYIEIPRGITVRDDDNADDEDALDNYEWRDTLGFYIYVSEKRPDGTRYIASSMYDLVAQISGDEFDFLDQDFAEHWARRNMLMVDFLLVKEIGLKLNMDDLNGEYLFQMIHQELYVDANGQSYIEMPEGIAVDKQTVSHINVTPIGDCTENALTKYLASKGLDSISMTAFYNALRGNGEDLMGNRDSLGSSQFKNLMYLVYGIYYTDSLTEEEKSAALRGEPLMTLNLLLDSSSYYYTYDFYYASDRKIMVSLYRSDAKGNKIGDAADDFYISTFAFKKLVRGFVGVMNAEDIDAEVGYPKED